MVIIHLCPTTNHHYAKEEEEGEECDGVDDGREKNNKGWLGKWSGVELLKGNSLL